MNFAVLPLVAVDTMFAGIEPGPARVWHRGCGCRVPAALLRLGLSARAAIADSLPSRPHRISRPLARHEHMAPDRYDRPWPTFQSTAPADSRIHIRPSQGRGPR
jgi:hypothetical protein